MIDDGGDHFGELFAPFFDIHADDPDVGRTVRGYRLVRVIGYGGMGKVFLAERADLERRVAFKLARTALRGAARRAFADEGRIHARLEHPNIATLYDAGTIEDGAADAGRPFFAMEYVDGRPIDEYCHEQRLGLGARLELFLVVAAAVQHAHRQPVVHLDLKPGNILVGAGGEPKLLDFGIARLLSPELEGRGPGSDRGSEAMTLQYASPEQLRGEAVSVASDLYSLGVVLYKLTTGRLPHDPPGLAGMEEFRRQVCEVEPPPPSAVAGPDAPAPGKSLAGDLDHILLKALAKDPSDRYGSVQELADDIRRHLEHRPVEAVDGGFAYKAGKLVRRHRLAVAVSAVFAALILGTFLATTVLWQRAEHALARAERASQFLEDLIKNAKPDSSRGEELTVRQLLDRGRRRIPADLAGEPELQIDMAGTFGEVLRELGDHEAASELVEEALATARAYYRGDHPEVVKRLSNVGASLIDGGRLDRAEELFRDALEMGRRLGQEPRALFRMKSNLASSLMLQGRFAEAEELYLEVLRERRRLYEPTHGSDDPDVATSQRNLGALYHAWGRLEEAERHLGEALATRRRIYGADDTRVAGVLDLLGDVAAEAGRRREAEDHHRAALSTYRERLGEDHPRVARAELDLAELYLDEDPETSRVLLGRVLEAYARSPPRAWEMAEAEGLLGALLLREGRPAEAEPCLSSSWETLAKIRGQSSIYAKKARRRLAELEEMERRLAGGDDSAGQPHDPQGVRSLPARGAEELHAPASAGKFVER